MTAILTNLVYFDKTQLQLINRRSLRYGLADAEKDYFLATVSQLIFESPLREKVVFKGGTALHHCYLDQLRFSEDLDFTSIDKTITTNKVNKVLESGGVFKVKKQYVSKATIKTERLLYNGPLGQANSLKVEIDFIQNVVLPAKKMKYNNVWGLDITVNVMDIREICAEKIRAMSDRARYRDFYDFYQILTNFDINLDEIVRLIKQKEVRKPITKKSTMQNWQLAKQDKLSDEGRIYYKVSISEQKIEEVLNKLPFEVIKAQS